MFAAHLLSSPDANLLRPRPLTCRCRNCRRFERYDAGEHRAAERPKCYAAAATYPQRRKPVSLPIRYFDAQLLIATYMVDYGRASALLKNTGVIAVPQGVGQALVAFGCFQYRTTDIGPYNEVGLTVLAAAPKSPVPALYVVHLPVDTASANRAGHEIWGYNEFEASTGIPTAAMATV